MAKSEYVSTEKAAKILGCSIGAAIQRAYKGKIKARKMPNFTGKGRAPWEFLRSALVASDKNFLDDAPERKPRAAAKRVKRPAAEGDGLGEIRWVLDGVKLGRFTPEQALEQIAEVVG